MTAREDDSLAEDLTQQAAAEAGAPSVGQVEVNVEVKPPPPFVKTIRDLIYWEYARLIAKAAHRENNYGFITSRFNKLKSGEIKWSDIENDNYGLTPKTCGC